MNESALKLDAAYRTLVSNGRFVRIADLDKDRS